MAIKRNKISEIPLKILERFREKLPPKGQKQISILLQKRENNKNKMRFDEGYVSRVLKGEIRLNLDNYCIIETGEQLINEWEEKKNKLTKILTI